MDAHYEPPVLEEIGSVHELTSCNKSFGPTDGHTFGGSPIACS